MKYLPRGQLIHLSALLSPSKHASQVESHVGTTQEYFSKMSWTGGSTLSKDSCSELGQLVSQVPVELRINPLSQRVHVDSSLHSAQFEGQAVQASAVAARKYPFEHISHVVVTESAQSMQFSTAHVLVSHPPTLRTNPSLQ